MSKDERTVLRTNESVRRLRSTGPPAVLSGDSRQVLSPNLVKNDRKDQSGANEGLEPEFVTKNDAANGDGKHLPGRHDDRKDDRSEFLDGFVDKELTRCRGNGGDNVVVQGNWILDQEFIDHGNVSRDEQSSGRNDNGTAVDTQHHLILIHVASTVLLIYFVLPLGREGITANVHDHKDQSDSLRVVVFLCSLGGK